MKLLILPLLFLLFAPQAFAEDAVDYDLSIAFAIDRTASKIPKEKVIFCLGPDQLDEFYPKEVTAEKRIARYAHAYTIDEIKSVGELIRKARNESTNATASNKRYELSVYRKTVKQAVVRIIGIGADLDYSQFRLKAGDLIIIRPVETGDK